MKFTSLSFEAESSTFAQTSVTADASMANTLMLVFAFASLQKTLAKVVEM